MQHYNFLKRRCAASFFCDTIPAAEGVALEITFAVKSRRPWARSGPSSGAEAWSDSEQENEGMLGPRSED